MCFLVPLLCGCRILSFLAVLLSCGSNCLLVKSCSCSATLLQISLVGHRLGCLQPLHYMHLVADDLGTSCRDHLNLALLAEDDPHIFVAVAVSDRVF